MNSILTPAATTTAHVTVAPPPAEGSQLPVAAIPTNEALATAPDTVAVLG